MQLKRGMENFKPKLAPPRRIASNYLKKSVRNAYPSNNCSISMKFFLNDIFSKSYLLAMRVTAFTVVQFNDKFVCPLQLFICNFIVILNISYH